MLPAARIIGVCLLAFIGSIGVSLEASATTLEYQFQSSGPVPEGGAWEFDFKNNGFLLPDTVLTGAEAGCKVVDTTAVTCDTVQFLAVGNNPTQSVIEFDDFPELSWAFPDGAFRTIGTTTTFRSILTGTLTICENACPNPTGTIPEPGSISLFLIGIASLLAAPACGRLVAGLAGRPRYAFHDSWKVERA
jgi:hypothetical protein